MELLVHIMRVRLAVQNDGRFTLYLTVLKTRHVVDHLFSLSFFFNGGREGKEEGTHYINLDFSTRQSLDSFVHY